MNLFKSIIHLATNRKLAGFVLLHLFIMSHYSHAETVRRWQDKNGQWHFGDASSSQGHKTQPVYISNPISIIQNDHAAKNTSSAQQNTSTKAPHRQGHRVAKAKTSQVNCLQLREQLYQQAGKLKRGHKAVNRQQQHNDYEHACIAGHYYGNSS